jgi:chromosome segregation ATPase
MTIDNDELAELERHDKEVQGKFNALTEEVTSLKQQLEDLEEEFESLEEERDDALRERGLCRDALDRLVSTMSDLLNAGMTVSHVQEVHDAFLAARAFQNTNRR